MTYTKKLIEVALPLMEISDASSSEKTLKNSHPANLHMWWARRLLAAARAVIWASLVDDPSSCPDRFPTADDQTAERRRLFVLLERLVQWESSDDQVVLEQAREEIRKSCGSELPRIVDPFSGGGAIPLESLRLGLPTFAGDLNPVAVLIERAMLQAVPRFANASPVHPRRPATLADWSGSRGLSTDFELYGADFRQLVFDRVGKNYPSVTDGQRQATPIAWIWARTVKSPDPSWPYHVPLVKSWVLAKRPGKPVTHVVPTVDEALGTISYVIKEGGRPADPTVTRGNGVCLATGTPIPGDYIKREGAEGRMGRVLLAVAAEGNRGRTYHAATAEHVEAARVDEPAWTPTGAMSDHPQYMGTPRYGLDEWRKLFTPRQLFTLATFVDSLAEVRSRVRADAIAAGYDTSGVSFADGGAGADAYSDAMALLLSFAIDKLADLNNSLARWEPVAQCPRQLFGRQAIQITWDYAEANPFSTSSGSFATILDGIARTLAGRAFNLPPHKEADVEQRDARSRLRDLGTFVLATDPPYYDNVPYADLSDFFYVWLRRGLGQSFPSDTATLLTPKSEELVADQKRFGSRDAAHAHFEEGMSEVFTEVAKSQDQRFPATLFYAFKAEEDREAGRVSTGWSSFLGSLINAGLTVTATWPIRTENKSRLRGANSNALASSVVLACRPRAVTASLATRGELISRLRAGMPDAVRVLQEQNIAPVDLAQSAIGPGIAIFSEYSRVVEADGSQMSVMSALGLINEVLAEILSGEESEFDADTRFALTWFEQYGHNTGPFGDADLLARAKDTTVVGVALAATSVRLRRDGTVELAKAGVGTRLVLPVSGRGARRWSQLDPYVASAVERLDAPLELVLAAGFQGPRPAALAPPEDIVGEDSSEDIAIGPLPPRVIAIDDLRSDPALVAELVS